MSFTSLVAAIALVAAAPPRPQDRDAVKRAIMGLIEKSPIKGSRFSLEVRSLDDGSQVFAQNADELLNPASNVKLFTAAAALARLGPDFRFETEFHVDAEARDGKVKNLWVRGKGDPTMTTDRLYGIVSELLHAGLKDIAGDIIIDDSYFDGQRLAPGFDQEHGDRAYLAPTGAVSINSNTIGLYIRPGASMGSTAAVEAEPACDYVFVDAHVSTGTRAQHRVHVAMIPEPEKERVKVSVSGRMGFGAPVESFWKKIDDPALYFGSVLKAQLLARGVKLKGKVKLGLVPKEGTRPLYVAPSETLDIALKKLNKHSSNFVAEQLIKVLGAEARGVPGSTAKGIDAVEEFLENDVGMPRGTYVMRNGSGLNDTNRFSAAQTNRLLRVMWERFPLAPEYLSSLPIAGKDGSVRNRFEGSDAVLRLRAKTGTLENVRALSGYVQSVGGERFAFSAYVNDFKGRGVFVIQHIDAMGAALAATGSAQGPGAAVASLTTRPSVVGPLDELKAKLKLYAAIAPKADKSQVAFLRTAWRSEKDPAVRLAIADSLYRIDRGAPETVALLLESVSAQEDVYGRLRVAAKELGTPVPGIESLTNVAVKGHTDAIIALLELINVAREDETQADVLADSAAAVADDAPEELLWVLKSSNERVREAAIEALAHGLIRSTEEHGAFWGSLKRAQGATDPETVEFARAVEVTLSQKVAQARAPRAQPGSAGADTPPGG